MSEKTIVFLVNAALTEALLEGYKTFRETYGLPVKVSVFSTQDVEESSQEARRLEEYLQSSDMVFLDVRGGGRSVSILHRILPTTSQPVVLLLGGSPDLLKLLRLGPFSIKIVEKPRSLRQSKPISEPNLVTIQKLMGIAEKIGSLLPFGTTRHIRNWARMMSYWNNGGPENIANLIAFGLREYLGFKKLSVPKPKSFPEIAIYTMDKDFTLESPKKYYHITSSNKKNPAVGILFYSGMHFSQSLVPTKALARALRARNINAIPLMVKTGHNLKAIKKFFMKDGKSVIDALIYLQWFQLTTFTGDSPYDSISLLKELDVPVISACPMYGGKIDTWEKSDRGLSPVEVLTTVVLPELDGMIEPIPTAGLKENFIDGQSFKKVFPILDNVEYLADRVKKWIELRRKPNRDKRIAFVIYDNPPGEDNIGSAAYLDTFGSLERIFKKMIEAGYCVEGVPEDEPLHEYFIRLGLINSPRWSNFENGRFKGVKISESDYSKISSSIGSLNEILSVWGNPPGEIMTTEGKILLPVVEFGNVLVGVQPPRGFHNDLDKINHDKSLPPHHQYVAFYRWIEDVWKADCIVHVGTHGTLEFLKGKEVGVSNKCFPPSLLGTIPHIYLYHVVNSSEATIAKRRSLGVIVNYSSPSYTTSGLYEGYERLESLIDEYIEARGINPQRAQLLESRILEEAKSLNIAYEDIPSIQEELSLMKRSIIPKGLHIIGEGPDDESRIEFATFLLRYDRKYPSLHRIMAENMGYSYEELLSPSSSNFSINASKILEKIEEEVKKIVRKAWHEGVYPKDEKARQAVKFSCDTAKKLDTSLEVENFLRGLNGGYIEPGLGSDPIRTPEALPTGRNSYQFDPRLVPSEEAMRRGREIAENTLKHYYRLHGTYPKSVGVILWGFETTKTRGETVAQVLSYLGVRIAPNSNPYYKKLEPIPVAELGRPRIDCLVQICGFFRDMYPNVLDMLHRAFQLVSRLEEGEDENFVKLHTQERLKFVEALTDDPEERFHLASGRIFGPRAGEYGTRVTHLIETASWKNEEELSSLFFNSMQNFYGGPFHGKALPKIYRKTLEQVDLVSQIRDSHDYEIVDLDHYYEFFGGLARTVESIRGKPPVMLITDTTKEVLRTETVKEVLNRGIRTRLLNPVWINALLEHPFHGAQKIADRIEYLIGFAATTHSVDDWVWSQVVNRYIRDEDLFNRMVENNRFAVEQIIARLMEAHNRGYWKATEEELSLLREKYLELEGNIEELIES